MAQRHINTKNGSLTMPTGILGVFQSFEVDETYASDSVTCYGTGVYGVYLTNGTPDMRLTVNGFTQHGAASSSPGWGAMTDHDGASTTVTFDTSSTLTGSFITSRIRASHSRSRAACPTVWELMASADITTSWSAS